MMLNKEDAADGPPLVAIKKDNVLDRLNKRKKDRQNYLEIKLEQRNKVNVQLEGNDYFAQTFTEHVQSINNAMQLITVNPDDTKVDISKDPTHMAQQFADITRKIQELQRYLTTSTLFLTDYKIKACQNILNELTNNSEILRQRLMPRKKFGFSSKKVNSPKTLLVSSVKGKDIEQIDGCKEIVEDSQKKRQFLWTLSNREDEHIVLSGDDVNNKDITISNLRNCFVELQGHSGSIQISKADDCTFLCGPVSRSLFAENCRNVNFAVACQQLRLHSSSFCQIYLHVTCRGIIEDCTAIDVAPYNYNYANIEDDFRLAGLDKSQNNYTDMADFNWLSPDIHSPNWKLLINSPTPSWIELRSKFKEKFNKNIIL